MIDLDVKQDDAIAEEFHEMRGTPLTDALDA
jgi:hypothetical protein